MSSTAVQTPSQNQAPTFQNHPNSANSSAFAAPFAPQSSSTPQLSPSTPYSNYTQYQNGGNSSPYPPPSAPQLQQLATHQVSNTTPGWAYEKIRTGANNSLIVRIHPSAAHLTEDQRKTGDPLGWLQYEFNGEMPRRLFPERYNGLRGMRNVPNPPDLHHWRGLLFNVDEMIALTEDE